MKERKLFSSSNRSLTNSGLTVPFSGYDELLPMNWVDEVERPEKPNCLAKAVEVRESAVDFLLSIVESKGHLVDDVVVEHGLFHKRMAHNG